MTNQTANQTHQKKPVKKAAKKASLKVTKGEGNKDKASKAKKEAVDEPSTSSE